MRCVSESTAARKFRMQQDVSSRPAPSAVAREKGE